MPYLREANKQYFEKLIAELKRCGIANGGELNYLFTEIINQYHVTNTKRYETMNTVVGALESCKTEYQRRIVGPYEDKKREENNEVYSEEVIR